MKFKLPGGGMTANQRRAAARKQRQQQRRAALKGTGFSLADFSKKEWAVGKKLPTTDEELRDARIQRRMERK